MEKMRFEYLESLVGIYPERELAKMAFQELIKCRNNLTHLGIEIDVPQKVILNGNECGREVLNDP